MAWIESHQSLGDHPKLLRLARVLGIEEAQAVGHLQYLWWWCLDYAEDGDLSRFDALDIAIAARWKGDADEFWNALVAVNFITDGHAHDWDDYAGRLIRQREAARHRQAERRKRQAAPAKPPVTTPKRGRTTRVTSLDEDVTRTSRSHHGDVRVSHASTVPNPTVPPPPVSPPASEPSASTPVPVVETDEPVTEQQLAPPTETWALIADVFEVTGADPADLGKTEKARQGAAARNLLRSYSHDDIVTCARWLWSDDWHRKKGIDLIVIQTQMTRWLTAGKPSKVAARGPTDMPERPPPAYYRDFPDS